MLAWFSSRQTYPWSPKFQQKTLCQSSHVLMNISCEIRWSRRSQLKLAGVEYAQFYGLLTTCGAGLPPRIGPAVRWANLPASSPPPYGGSDSLRRVEHSLSGFALPVRREEPTSRSVPGPYIKPLSLLANINETFTVITMHAGDKDSSRSKWPNALLD